MTNKPDDLVDRLRDRAYAFKAKDPLLEEAANEIERLRGYRDMAEADRDVAMLAAERLRCVTEPLPQKKLAEVPLPLTDEELEA
jgi:hypothetical protein